MTPGYAYTAVVTRSDPVGTAGARRLDQLHLRDPFVLVEREAQRYWLYGTTDANPWQGPGTGFDAWWSIDLDSWQGPVAAFRPPPGFWAESNFWAPEVWFHGGRWVMFATFFSRGSGRGVQTLIADRPSGPFVPLSEGPVTPPDWECLDGTLHVDPDGVPWLVFCHEWLQVDDGRMCALPLTPELDRAAGEPIELFRASSAPWVLPIQERHHFVTDGPFLHRTPAGVLLMLWTSNGRRGYVVGLARSATGELRGPWQHRHRPLNRGDGGHAMLFRSLDGRLMMALHAPNRSPLERPRLMPMDELEDDLRLTPRSGAGDWWRRLRARVAPGRGDWG